MFQIRQPNLQLAVMIPWKTDIELLLSRLVALSPIRTFLKAHTTWQNRFYMERTFGEIGKLHSSMQDEDEPTAWLHFTSVLAPCQSIIWLLIVFALTLNMLCICPPTHSHSRESTELKKSSRVLRRKSSFSHDQWGVNDRRKDWMEAATWDADLRQNRPHRHTLGVGKYFICNCFFIFANTV